MTEEKGVVTVGMRVKEPRLYQDGSVRFTEVTNDMYSLQCTRTEAEKIAKEFKELNGGKERAYVRWSQLTDL